jgi:hypothetical protein
MFANGKFLFWFLLFEIMVKLNQESIFKNYPIYKHFNFYTDTQRHIDYSFANACKKDFNLNQIGIEKLKQ